MRITYSATGVVTCRGFWPRHLAMRANVLQFGYAYQIGLDLPPLSGWPVTGANCVLWKSSLNAKSSGYLLTASLGSEPIESQYNFG